MATAPKRSATSLLTSVALLTWSVTLLVPWPLLALLLVPLLGGVLLTLLTLLA